MQTEWFQEANRLYNPDTPTRVGITTKFSRSRLTIDVLERVLTTASKPNILFVGLGSMSETGPLQGIYSPFVAAGLLDSKGADYSMTLVDAIPKVLEDVAGQTHLAITHEEVVLDGASHSLWRDYLSFTHQQDRRVYTREEGIKFTEYAEKDEKLFTPDFYLKQGIHLAKIPKSFKRKLLNGEVALVEDDIALVDLKDRGKFDFIECMNILCYLPEAGQKLAMANMANALSAGGRILMSDVGLYMTGNTTFPEFPGGWLDQQKLEDMSLVREHFDLEYNPYAFGPRSDYEGPTSATAVLRRISA